MKFTLSAIATTFLLVLPSTTLAAVSLKEVEPISSSEVVQGCTNAYNANIAACSKEQFTSGSCTEECITDLQAHSTNVMLACRQAFAGPGTLLRKIIDGGLVVTLCPGGAGGDAKTTKAPTGSATGTGSVPSATAQASQTTSVDGSATILPEPVDNNKTGNNNGTEDDEKDNGSGRAALSAGVLFVAVIAGFASAL